ncbi:AMP-binding protein [Vibrio sp.]|nr:AMP-binding protein [Vibrio sp.]
MNLFKSLEIIRSRNDNNFINLLRDGCHISESLSGEQFYGSVASIAKYLRTSHPDARRIGLVYPSGGFLISPVLFGCISAGCLAIPIKIPKPRRKDDRASSVLKAADLDLVIVPEMHADVFRNFIELQGLDLKCILHEDLIALPHCSLEGLQQPDQDRPVILQFTSGSTGVPKGIGLSLQMIEANCQAIAESLSIHQQAQLYNWMPFFHDFGLIFGVLLPVFLGRPIFQVDPMTFVQDPNKCLKGLERNSITHTAFASFALGHCIENADPVVLKGLDLSRLQKIMVGADLISPELVEEFRTLFLSYGLSYDVVVSGYGMAEATLVVTVSRGGVHSRVISDPNWRGILAEGEVLSCGEPVDGVSIRIQDIENKGKVVSCGDVGEVLVSGPSVIKNYFGQTDESIIQVYDGLPYFPTGDLGFFQDGSLFVCGRKKELLIVNGENFSPVLIEEICLEALCLKRAAYQASSYVYSQRGMDFLGIAIEIPTAMLNRSEVKSRLEEAVFQATDLALGRIDFFRKGTLPKTSSGKLMRTKIAATQDVN